MPKYRQNLVVHFQAADQAEADEVQVRLIRAMHAVIGDGATTLIAPAYNEQPTDQSWEEDEDDLWDWDDDTDDEDEERLPDLDP